MDCLQETRKPKEFYIAPKVTLGYAQCKTPIFSYVMVENFMGNEKVHEMFM